MNQENTTITERASEVIQMVLKKHKVPPMLTMLLNPYLEQFLQLSDEETDDKVLNFITEMETYIHYIKTGKTSNEN